MDDPPMDELPRSDEPSDAGPDGPDSASQDRGGPGSHVDALATEAAEIRRLIDAGAGSPEELRELAARLRDHRAREESLWRQTVRPGLVKENKGRFRGFSRTPKDPSPRESRNLGAVVATIIVLVVLVVIAANTSALLLVVPFVGLLGWAWKHGRDTMSSE